MLALGRLERCGVGGKSNLATLLILSLDTFPLNNSRSIRSAPLLKKRHLRTLDMHHRLREPRPLDRLAHLDPRHRAVEIMPDQPAARRQGLIDLAAIVQHMFQVVRAVDEREVERGQPAEVIRHRVGRDEERLVSRAEVISEPAPIRMIRHLALLFDRAGRDPGHASNQVDGEDTGIFARPPRQVRRHVSERRADLQHVSWLGMQQQRQHHPRIILAGIAAERPRRSGDPNRSANTARLMGTMRRGYMIVRVLDRGKKSSLNSALPNSQAA